MQIVDLFHNCFHTIFVIAAIYLPLLFQHSIFFVIATLYLSLVIATFLSFFRSCNIRYFFSLFQHFIFLSLLQHFIFFSHGLQTFYELDFCFLRYIVLDIHYCDTIKLKEKKIYIDIFNLRIIIYNTMFVISRVSPSLQPVA